jgi:hypothetical protein
MTAEVPAAGRLLHVLEVAEPQLRAITEDDSAVKPAPSKWSPREIVGHLIDSATNNHQRFVRGALENTLVFTGYAQNEWVSVQAYQSASWSELVTLWASYNRHIAHVMRVIPESDRTRPHTRNNLHEITSATPVTLEQMTLDFLMSDYVRHLEHHIRQILGSEWTPDGSTRQSR